MVFREVVAHHFAFFAVGHPGHRRLEEKHPQDSEKNEKFENDQPHERLAPGHIAESVSVETEHGAKYGGAVFHLLKNNQKTWFFRAVDAIFALSISKWESTDIARTSLNCFCR